MIKPRAVNAAVIEWYRSDFRNKGAMSDQFACTMKFRIVNRRREQHHKARDAIRRSPLGTASR